MFLIRENLRSLRGFGQYEVAPETPVPATIKEDSLISNISSLFSSLVGSAEKVGTAYFSSKAGVRPVTSVVSTGGTGILSSSMLPILGIIGIGAFLMLRGKKKS